MTGLDVRAIEIFVAIVEAGGITAAAHRLAMSQSAVSQKLAALEQALGTVLLDRGVRPIAPSVAGQILLERARPLLHALSETEQAVRDAARIALPRLRLALIDSAAATIGPPLVRELRGLAQTIQMRSGLAPAHAEHLCARDVDLIITPESELDHQPGFRSTVVLTEPYVLIVPPSYQGPTDTLAALASGLELVRYTPQSVIGRDIDRHLNRLRLNPARHLEFDTTEALVAMVAGGVGWGITTPLCLLQVANRVGSIRCLPLPRPRFTRRLRLVGRGAELGSAYDRVAETCLDVLRRECLPAIGLLAPGLADGIAVGDQPQPAAAPASSNRP